MVSCQTHLPLSYRTLLLFFFTQLKAYSQLLKLFLEVLEVFLQLVHLNFLLRPSDHKPLSIRGFRFRDDMEVDVTDLLRVKDVITVAHRDNRNPC